MRAGASSSTALGAMRMPGKAGSVAWHMEQRVATIWVTSSKLGRAADAAAAACGSVGAGPADDNHTIATMPAAATPQVHHGAGLPAWRALKKWRITGPIASTMAKISQLKRVANTSG